MIFEYIFFQLGRPGPKGGWAEINPKNENGARTGPKENLLVAGLNPAAWAGLMFQPKKNQQLVTVLSTVTRYI